MKLKGLTKLALSGAALAAVAATLGTSTYAWYVTNAKASVKGVEGAAKSIGAGTILVAQNMAPLAADATPEQTAAYNATYATQNGHTEFLSEITMTSDNLHTNNGGTAQAPVTGLDPVTPGAFTQVTTNKQADASTYYTYDSANSKYQKLDTTKYDEQKTYYTFTPATVINSSTKWYNADGEEKATNNYIQYDIWLYSSKTATVNLEFAFANTTLDAAFEEQVAYATGAPVANGQTFVMNIKDALRFAYTQTDYANAPTTTYAYALLENGATYDGNTTYYVATKTSPDTSKAEDFTIATEVSEENFDEVKGTLYTRTVTQANNWSAITEDAQQQPIVPTTTFVDVAACATKSTYSDISFDFASTNGGTNGNANTYYQNVLGKAPNFTTTTTPVTNKANLTISLTGGLETKLSFYTWLEGTDVDCFDSVAGQSFEFTYTFKS